MTERQALGIDIGGTKAAAVRIAHDGAVLARAAQDTPADDVQETLSTTTALVETLHGPAVAAIGIGAAGLVEAATGRVRYAPNLAWREVDLASALSHLDVPVRVDNDCTVATFGEHRIGAGRGVDELLYVGVGTGIGGGFVANGRLVRGAHGFAGEVGHVVVDPGGRRCGCGARGCWETVASGSAITRLGHERLGPEVDGPGVVEAARDGDAVARRILAEVGAWLGVGIAGLVNVLDPSVVVIGGGAGVGAGDLLLEPARASFRDTVEAREHRPEVPIVLAGLGVDAAAVGAALWALEETA
jgi:glucokinase